MPRSVIEAEAMERRQLDVRRLYEAGFGTPTIARELDGGRWSQQTIHRDVVRMGLDRRGRDDPWGAVYGGKLSLTRAAERFDVPEDALRRLTIAGAVRAERIEYPGLGPDGIGFAIDERECAEDLAAAPRCIYTDKNGTRCEQIASTETGGCGDHHRALTRIGVPLPNEVGEKISEAQSGRPRPDCSERLLETWKTGTGIRSVVVGFLDQPRIHGDTRQRVHGRWKLVEVGEEGRKEGSRQAAAARSEKHVEHALVVGAAAIKFARRFPAVTTTGAKGKRVHLEALMDPAVVELGTADAKYQAERRKTVRALETAYDKLGRPTELSLFS